MAITTIQDFYNNIMSNKNLGTNIQDMAKQLLNNYKQGTTANSTYTAPSVTTPLTDYKTGTTSNTTYSAPSVYSFDDWLKTKNYTLNYDQNTQKYDIGGIQLDSSLIAKLNKNASGKLYGTGQTYEDILANYTSLASTQYKSKYDQQIQDLLAQLEQFKVYETPEEYKTYIDKLLETANQPFTYDPTQDQGLINAQKEADSAIREATGQRGTLFSSGTVSSIAKQQAALIPAYEEKAYSRFADQRNREIQLASTIMQWDQMAADRNQDQLELIKTKFDYFNSLDQMEFEKFSLMLQQANFEKEYKLEQQRLALEKKQQEIEQAWNRVNAVGYVDNTTSVILGLKVGTKAGWVKELELQQKNALDIAKKEYENNKKLQDAQKKIDKSLIDYKAGLEYKNQKELLKKQYEYDKKIAQLQGNLELAGITGGSQAKGIIATANSLSGLKYVWGGTSTTKGMDCSGFTQYVMKQNGISLPRTAAEQAKKGSTVSWGNLQAGDLIFYNTISGNNKSVDHVGIYVGNGQMIHASSGSGKVITVSINTSYWKGKFTTAKRYSGSGSSSSGGSSGSSSSSGSVGRNTTTTSTKQIQTYLRNYGIGVTADGKYGPDTTKAIKNFQKAKGLTPDGIVGPKTLAALKKYAKKPSTQKLPYL